MKLGCSFNEGVFQALGIDTGKGSPLAGTQPLSPNGDHSELIDRGIGGIRLETSCEPGLVCSVA